MARATWREWKWWRRWLLALHRDLGFLAIGLTLVYGVSGIAVNHYKDWDYNYWKETRSVELGTPEGLLAGQLPAGDGAPKSHAQLARAEQARLVKAVSAGLGRSDAPKKVFWRGPDRLSLFFGVGGRDVVDYYPNTGVAIHTQKGERAVLRATNFLHLNEPGRTWWTLVADLFAGVLIFLAISGALIVKGRRGLRGRGGILTALGMALPIAAWFMLS